MEPKEDGLCNPSSLERQLRLRKDYKGSTDNKVHLSDCSNDECKKNDTSNDDSILDFKSPKRMCRVQPKIINSNKYTNKSKKKVLCSKSKVTNNERKIVNNEALKNRKILHDTQQPSIESSFFKSEKGTDSTDVKTACVCPLCFKKFKDESLQAVHMKSCAIKNNISTKELMVAVELQERQAAERKSLGLLSAPVLQEKKKSASRKLASHDDPDLQLALALSKSLYDKEEMEEWDKTQMVIISSSPSLLDGNAEQAQKITLQNFGFISDRNASPADNLPINKTKRKGRPIERTILQRRTAEERERILTERMAEILMGCKDFTQRLQEEEKCSDNIKKNVVIKNLLLKQWRQIDNTLWDRTKLTSNGMNSTEHIFYVKQLLPQITPSEKEEHELNKEQDIIKLTDQSVNNGKPVRKERTQEIKGIVETAIDKELTISSNAMEICCREKRFLDIFVKTWGNILNDSSASDIIVFVKNDKHIWTHKLVFYVRCPNILLDVISNDTEFSAAKEKICWIDTDYDIALAFLEFIYCGVISRNSKMLDIDESLSSIRSLARTYKVNDLFAYLRQRELTSDAANARDDCNISEESMENMYENVKKTSNILKLDESAFNTSPNHTRDYLRNRSPRKALLDEDTNDNTDSLNRTAVEKSYVLQDENVIFKKVSDKVRCRSDTPTNFDSRASPDMFDDTSDAMRYNDTIMYSNEHENPNIHALLSLIKQDADASICSERSPVGRTRSAETTEGTTACSENIEQDVIEIDSDRESNSIESPIDNLQENSLNDDDQSSKSSISKQKSNLTLFIEKIQRDNARSDSDLDTDSDIECAVQVSFTEHKNLFHIDKHVSKDLRSYNVEQPVDREKKPGRLSVIERCIQSYANKNPEFYSSLSNKHEQIDVLHPVSVSRKGLIESSYDDTLNYAKSNSLVSPIEKDSNFTKEDLAVMSSPVACSLPRKANDLEKQKLTSQSSHKAISDVEMDEAEISMYSKYMKDHKDNSIAKYRATIRKDISEDSDLSNENTLFDSINGDNDIDECENDKVLTQKNAGIIVPSDTEIESISSGDSLQNDDAYHGSPISHFLQQSKKSREDSRQNVQYKGDDNQLISIAGASTANLEQQRAIDGLTGSNRDEVNSSAESRSDTVDAESEISDDKHRDKFMPENTSDNRRLKKSIEHPFNFEDDIYLANVDVDRYEKQRGKQILERSQSTSLLNATEFKRSSARRCINNKSSYENIKTIGSIADGVMPGDRDVSSQNLADIRKFKRKSLSEGQIDTKRLRDQETTFKPVPLQLQCNRSENIGAAKTALKIFDKDVTPSPDYNRMSTPELHKEMKKYGLKIQKRSRAAKLLSHIYNELHPLVPTTEVITEQRITEISSDEDDGPPLKKRNVEDEFEYVEISNNAEDNDKLLCSQDTVSKEMEFYETESSIAFENSSDITEAFTKLINLDKDLYNKILQYEPVNIEELRCTLRAQGFKCKLPNLMSFLDGQCITFYVPEQSTRRRIRRKT